MKSKDNQVSDDPEAFVDDIARYKMAFFIMFILRSSSNVMEIQTINIGMKVQWKNGRSVFTMDKLT